MKRTERKLAHQVLTQCLSHRQHKLKVKRSHSCVELKSTLTVLCIDANGLKNKNEIWWHNAIL